MTTTVDSVDDLTIPSTADELEEMLHDGDRMAAVYANPDLTAEFIQAYAKTVYSKDRDMAAQIKDQVQKGVRDFLKENGADDIKRLDQTPDTDTDRVAWAGKAQRPEHYEPRAAGAKIDGLVGSLGEYFETIWSPDKQHDPKAQELRSKFRNAFSTDVPAQGGFLVPEEFRADLLSVALQDAVVRPRATVVPMGGPRVAIPFVDDTTHAGTNGVFGGVVGYWTEEAATLTQSQPSFGRVVLDAKKLTIFSVAPSELVQDSAISFDALTSMMFARSIAWHEDKAFMNGSGAGEPEGFTNAAAYLSVAKETGQAATTIVWENLVKAYSRMIPSSLGRAVWIAHPDTMPELATMALSVGTGGAPVWLANGVGGVPTSILGRPLILSEHCATLGTVNDIQLVDLGFYLVGDRQQMSAMSSEHSNFSTDSIAYRVIQRVDGRMWLQDAITPANGSNTLSAAVGVATRA